VSRHAWAWLRAAAAAAILGVLAWRLGTGAFTAGLRLIDGQAVLAALGIGLVTTALSVGRWWLVARRLGLPLPLGTAMADYYQALFLNAVLPAGVLGDAHRAVRHGRRAGDVGRGVRAVVLERAGGQVVFAVAGAAALAADPSLARAVARDLAHGLGAAAAVLILAAAVASAVAVWAWRGAIAVKLRGAFAVAVADMRTGLLSKDTWPGVLLLSAGALAGYLTLFLVAARTAGATAPVGRLIPLMLLALLGMLLPVGIGGWGPREALAAVAFGTAGLGAELGLTAAVTYGVLTFVAGLPGGLVLAARCLTRPAGRHDAPPGPPAAPPEPLVLAPRPLLAVRAAEHGQAVREQFD